MAVLFLGPQSKLIEHFKQPDVWLQRLLELVQRAWLAGQSARRKLAPWTDLGTAFALSVLHLVLCLRFTRYCMNDFCADGQQFKTALDLAEGGVICRDTWTQYGVFTHYMHAGAILLFGKHLFSIKYYTSFVYGLMTCAQFFLLRRFLPWSLAVLTALAWIGVAPHYIHGVIPWPHVDALLFILLSILSVIRFIDREQTRYLWLAGILTGLSWAAKQSVGAYQFVALFAFVNLAYLQPITQPADLLRFDFWRKVLANLWSKGAPLVVGFLGVVAVVVFWLACRGAYEDWKAQTIVFSRAYYLDYYLTKHIPAGKLIVSLFGPPWKYGLVKQVLALLITWYQESINNAIFPLSCGRHWFVMWLAAILMGMRALFRSDRDSRTCLLMALVAATSYLATVPSMNVMHQWWTLTPVFGMLGFFFLNYFNRFTPLLAWCATTFLLLFLFVAPVYNNLAQIPDNRVAIVTKVPALKGMRATPSIVATMEKVYLAIKEYQQEHPNAKVITLDVEPIALAFLPCLEHNRNFHPIYFSCPVLTDMVYPDYSAKAVEYLRQAQPLVITVRHPWVKQVPSLEEAGYQPIFEIGEPGTHPVALYAPAAPPG